MNQIKLPNKYSSIFNTEVVLMEGYNNSVFIYSTRQYTTVLENIKNNADITYPVFNLFHDRGIYHTKIGPDGALDIPERLQQVLGQGKPLITNKDLWIEYRHTHLLSCYCNDFNCAKCKKAQCKDKNCNIHKLLI